jgi:hypothetical protein
MQTILPFVSHVDWQTAAEIGVQPSELDGLVEAGQLDRRDATRPGVGPWYRLRKRRKRIPGGKRQTGVLSTAVTQEEYAAVHAHAQAEGVSVSALLHDALRACGLIP